MRKCFLLITLLLFSSVFSIKLEANAGNIEFLTLRGFLTKKTLERVENQLGAMSPDVDTLLLEVNSSAGELQTTLEIARLLYETKAKRNAKIIVYIDGEAIGPAAILPFLADELFVSVFVTWGDISLGKSQYPKNLLRTQARSLVPEDHSKVQLLKGLAEAMADESLEVWSGEKGWSVGKEPASNDVSLVSSAAEALVVDHNQLRELELVSAILPVYELREDLGLLQAINPLEGQDVGQAKDLVIDSQDLIARLKEHITFDDEGPNYIGYIWIDDESGIDQSTWIYVQAALKYYQELKPKMIVLELNTPGGQVFAAQKISDALKEMDSQHGIPVVAHINNWAISAGAMLAYSCRFIAVAQDASMGAAEPVFAGSSGQMESAPEKINSALRTDFGNRAAFFSRDPLLAKAMVDEDMFLVMRHGEIVQLDSEDDLQKEEPSPDKIIIKSGKLLTLSSKELLDYGVVDFRLTPQSVPMITETELNAGKWPASKSLVFTHPFFKEIPNTIVDAYQMDWKTSFLAFLALPAVASLLFMGMMVGGYMELNSPGLGLPGVVSLLCISMIIFSSFALDAVHWIEVFFLFLGVVFIGLELFVIPGFGIAGVLGILFVACGLVAMMLPGFDVVGFEWDTGTVNAAGEAALERLVWLCVGIIGGVIGIALAARYAVPNLAALSYLVSEGEQNRDEGYVTGALAENLPKVGTSAVVAVTLRPAGKIEVDGRVYDAVSNGTFIEKGREVVVSQVDGVRMIVEAKDGGA